MLNSLFHIFAIFSFVVRIPLAFVFIVLRPLIKPLRERIDFERKNLIDDASYSYRKIGQVADYLFHVSSEGELEQSLTLIDYYLSIGKKIEIIFTSPSVEKKCGDLYMKNPTQVRILRLPVISFFPFPFLYFQSIYQFITSPVVILCRYDFFPELLYLKFFRKKMILISAATKNWNKFKHFAFSFFDLIIAATPKEAALIQTLVNVEVRFMEFRFSRIFDRQKATQKLMTDRHQINQIFTQLKNYSDEKIIFGSMWASDLEIFNDASFLEQIKQNKILIFIAPHKLNREYIDHLKDKMSVYIPREMISELDQINVQFRTPIVINTLPGMLCETFQFFDCAYIGGGYEKSIHSVLEPFLMGTKVICGPKIHRSTEYDYINEIAPNEIVVLNDAKFFYNKWKELKIVNQTLSRVQLQQAMEADMQKIVQLIG